MRVAFVSAHYAPMIGGVEKHIVEIAGRLARQGHNVHVITHEEANADLPSVEDMNGVIVERFQTPVPSQNFALSPALSLELSRSASTYDVVHAHGYHALPALQAALAAPPALVFTPHYHGTGHSPFRKLLHPPYRRLGRLIFERAAKTVAVSPPEARLILTHFPEVEPRLVVIPNGVDQDALDAAVPFDETATVILSAGRLESYKQVDKTVDALATLPDDFILRITGDGAARPALEEQVRMLSAERRVSFLGKVSDEDLHRWFKSTSVYVSMSSNEAMPVTFIEALAAGARVVASDIPAHRDLVTKTQGSIRLVPLDAPPGDVAGAIRELAASPAAPALIDTWDDVVAKTLDVYEDAIKTGRASRR